MKQFAVLIHVDESEYAGWTPETHQKHLEAHRAYAQALGSAMLGGERLRPGAEAVRVTLRGGKRTVLDGPFAETKEVFGGYYLIQCDTKEQAVEWAARCPSAEHGTIEVREVWPTVM